MSTLHSPTATTRSRSALHPPGTPATAMRELSWLTTVPIAAVGLLVVVSIVSPQFVRTIALPLAIAGSAIGIPHGAVDFLVPSWWASESAEAGGLASPKWRRRLIFLTSYAGVAAAALIALLLAPTPTFMIFLLLSAFHFGRGEMVTAAERAGRAGSTIRWDRLASAAHGLVVVGLLVWAAPSSIDPYVRPLSPWISDAITATRTPALVTIAAAVALAAILLWRSGRRLETAELVLLAVAFRVAPPLAAFGVYFGAWHALRHTGRLLDLTRERRDNRGVTDTSWLPAVWDLAKASTAPTVVAFAAVAVLWLGRDLASLQAEVAVLLALTFPHAGVVWVLDRQQSEHHRR